MIMPHVLNSYEQKLISHTFVCSYTKSFWKTSCHIICTRISLLGVIWCFLLNYAYTQDNFSPKVDSLLHVIEQEEGYEAQVAKLLDISFQLPIRDAQAAHTLLGIGEQWATNQKDTNSIRRIVGTKGLVYKDQENYPKAIEHIEECLRLSYLQSNKASILYCLNRLNIYNNKISDYQSALRYALQYLEAVQEFGEDDLLPKAYAKIGDIYSNIYNYDSAIVNHKKALSITSLEDEPLEYLSYQRAIGSEFLQKIKEDPVYKDSALFYLLGNYALLDSSIGPSYWVNNQRKLARYHLITGNPEQAIAYLKKNLQIVNEINDGTWNQDLLTDNSTLVRLYSEQGDVVKAAFHLEAVLQNPLRKTTPFRRSSLYYHQMKYFAGAEQYDSAFHYSVLYKEVQDSINKASFEQDVAHLAKKYELDVKDEQLVTKEALLKESNRAARNMQNYLYALGGLMISGVVIAFLLIRNREKKRQLREAGLQRELEQNRQNLISALNRHEIEALSKMIEGQEMEKRRIAAELHDAIGGTMAALKMNFAYILQAIKISAPDLKDPFEQTQQMLTTAVQEVRGLSHQMSAKPLMNASLYGAVHELGENVSIGADFELSLDIESIRKVEVPSHVKLHLYRIIQEAFQNIIKYAAATHVQLSLHIRKNILFMEVVDDGKGFHYVKDQPLPGIGLNNIQRRVQQMNGDWQLITSKGQGVQIRVEVPWIQEDETEIIFEN